MGILDELLKKSTGMQSLLNGSLDDASGMNSDFERPFEEPNPNYKILEATYLIFLILKSKKQLFQIQIIKEKNLLL
jgi:hypothetical protein